MEIYMDNAATTRVYDSVIDTVARAMHSDYGNPSSLHTKGVEAESYIRGARKTFAGLMKVDEKELIFTSGGTEANNMALIGAAYANKRKGMHIISTCIEHASVYQPLMYLEKQGFEVSYLPVDAHGVVDLNKLKDAVRTDTILVSIMCVNNEIGTIQPIKAASDIIKSINPGTLIHVDAIQAFGKMVIHPRKLGIDMLSISGHKFHGPKGTGLLWVRDKVKINPLILGGGQQKDMRSGTENVPGVAGMARAAEMEYSDFDEKINCLYGIRDYFIEEIGNIDGTHINGGIRRGSLMCHALDDAAACAAPHIVSVSFDDVRAEVLLHALADSGIYVSSGSACSSNHPAISGTLKAIGVEKRYLDATIRFSFSMDTTRENVDACMEALNEILPRLRRYTAGGRKRR